MVNRCFYVGIDVANDVANDVAEDARDIYIEKFKIFWKLQNFCIFAPAH